MSAHSYSGLYYPFIHFKDDNWLKLTALYWDRMGRIVPRSYAPEDSPTVRDLGDYVETLRPEWVRPEFGTTFMSFIDENGRELRARFDVRARAAWPAVEKSPRPPRAGSASGADPRLSYVFFEKMSPELQEIVLSSNVAMLDPEDPRWIGMHPLLADVYMTALAEQLSRERLMYPLTDETTDHLAVGGASFDRVAQALLAERAETIATAPIETESVAACVALQAVVPKDLNRVPVSRILEFREKYPEERGSFQQYIQNFAAVRQWLSHARDRRVLEDRLRDEYHRNTAPQLKQLREKLRDCNIDSVTGVLSMKVEMPGIALAAAGLLGVVAAPVGIVAGVALAVIPILRSRAKEKETLRRDPVSYLLRVEEELQPVEVASWIDKRAAQLWSPRM